ncbi:uncharacterized protein LOC124900388 [Homo sapiens]|uniref:NLRP1 protein n=1 Tax=Homo sapiens TaxID=9606 RepID=Q96AM0_HUMAN
MPLDPYHSVTWGHAQGSHHFVFGELRVRPILESLRDEPDPDPRPSREGPAGRVGALARGGPEPCDAASPPGGASCAPELARPREDKSAQQAKLEGGTRLCCRCPEESRLVPGGAVSPGDHVLEVSGTRGTCGCRPRRHAGPELAHS